MGARRQDFPLLILLIAVDAVWRAAMLLAQPNQYIAEADRRKSPAIHPDVKALRVPS